MTQPTSKNSYEGLRQHLQEELVARCERRPGYSLRAFARFLDMEPSALSKIIKGQRKITQKSFEKIVSRLLLSPEQVAQLQKPQTLKSSSYHDLNLDQFRVIADWYHYAILELTHIVDFKPDPKWVAKQLGLTVSEVNIAVERLQRLELLEVTKEGQWQEIPDGVTTISSEFTNSAFKKMQKQILDQAKEAMDMVDFEERDQSSMTMAIDSAKIPEAKNMIKKFRRELCDFLQSGAQKDRVYQLCLSLFPIDFKKHGGSK